MATSANHDYSCLNWNEAREWMVTAVAGIRIVDLFRIDFDIGFGCGLEV
jgi:hypothetical protein